MARHKTYFKIGIKNGRLEYHTGTNASEVSRMISLNHAVRLTDSTPERVAELVVDWLSDVNVYNMTMAP